MWEISGEIGKAFPEVRRASEKVATDIALSYESLQPDVLTWSVQARLSDFSDLTLPELGQTVEVWRDNVRQFSGVVTGLPATVSGGSLSGEVRVEGPHWWLENTPITEDVVDDASDQQDRATYFFAKGDVKAHIQSLFARAKLVGLPVEIGAVADCYDIPQITVSNQSYAAALAGLLRLVPDALTWWDYSVAGTPEFRVERRDTAGVITLTNGAAPMVSATLQPRLGLEVEEVVVQYAERAPTGETLFKEQSSGTGTNGKKQVVVTSGVELGEFLPDDPIESTNLTTTDIWFSGSFRTAALEDFWTVWIEWMDNYTIPGTALPFLFRWNPLSPGYPGGVAAQYYEADGTVIVGASSGILDRVATVSGSLLPSWLFDELPFVNVRLSGTVYIRVYNDFGVFPDWLDFITSRADHVHTVNEPTRVAYYCYFNLDIELAGLKDPHGPFNGAPYTQALSYQFSIPPDGFASAIQAAQSFVPYEGRVETIHDSPPGTADLGKVLNIDSALPAWSGMKALVQGLDITLSNGSQTLRLGAPQRLSFSDIASRLRVDPRDNIVRL